MQFSSLNTFRTVVEAKSYSRAAYMLYVSQSAITQQIHTIEAEVGFELFDHSKRRVVLTPAGKIFYERAKTLLSYYDRAVSDAKAAAGNQTLSFTIGYDFHDMSLQDPGIMAEYLSDHPDVSIQIQYQNWNDLLANLYMQQLDLVMYSDPPQLPRDYLFVQTATRDYGIAMLPENPLSKHDTLTLQDLNGRVLYIPSAEISDSVHTFQAEVSREVPNCRMLPSDYVNLTWPLVKKTGGLYLTDSTSAASLTGLECRPIVSETKIPMGFVLRRDCDARIRDFVNRYLSAPGK